MSVIQLDSWNHSVEAIIPEQAALYNEIIAGRQQSISKEHMHAQRIQLDTPLMYV